LSGLYHLHNITVLCLSC